MRYRFGDLDIDEDSFALRRNDVLVRVEPRVLEVVIYLIRNRSRLVTKDELIDQVWHGSVVSESIIPRAVCLARALLKPQAAIRTVHGRGYQWNTEVLIDITVTNEDLTPP
jgi:DNA-binding winged helix-turn-helix (wHTH) protein